MRDGAGVRDFSKIHDLTGQEMEAIRRQMTRPWSIMEVCGGQTHSIVRFGLDEMLPPELTLIHGPGCPVCVTPLEILDAAIAIASTPGVVFCSFGDMLRVPGSVKDLLTVKSEGGDVRIVYSPMDAVSTRLVIDPQQHDYLFGMTVDTRWRYALPALSTVLADPTRNGETVE